jgi:hypothetical protein
MDAKVDMAWVLKAVVCLGYGLSGLEKFLRRAFLQKGRHHLRIVLKRTETKMTLPYVDGREDLM